MAPFWLVLAGSLPAGPSSPQGNLETDVAVGPRGGNGEEREDRGKKNEGGGTVRAAAEKGEHRRNGKDLRSKTAERGNGPRLLAPNAETNAKRGPAGPDDPRSRTLFSVLAAPP